MSQEVPSVRASAMVSAALCLAIAASAQTAPPQEAKKAPAAPRRPASCAQEVRYYELSPGTPEPADKMAKCFKARNRSEEAAAIFRRVAEKPGTPPLGWKFAAQAYADAHLFPEAEAAYLKYLQKTPGDIEARLSLASLYNGEKAYEKATEQYRVVLSSRPKYSPALAGMARTLFFQGQQEESLRYFDRAIAANPRDVDAESGKAYLLLWMGRVEEAQALFSKLHERHPKDDNIARGLQQAQVAVQDKAVAAAVRSGSTAPLEAEYRQRLAQNPRDLSALRALAELTAGPQRCAETIGFRRKAAELAPTDPTVGTELARSLADCDQFEEAIARYRKTLEIQPQNEVALFELGNTLRRAGRMTESTGVFQNVLRLNPRNSDAQLGLARALAALGKDDEALVHYDEVLKLSPDNYEALQGKAYLLFWTSKYAEARAVFQTLAQQRPADAQNAQALQQIAAAEEDARWTAIRPAPSAPLQDWQRYYEKRLASYPKDSAALKGWAYIQVQMKNYPEAIKGYRRVLEAYPDDHASKIELARLLSWEGQLDESISLYQGLLKETPSDTEVLESLARVYIWADRPQEALETYQKLLAQNPSNLSYQLELARLQLRLKDSPAAREFLTAVLAADPKNREAMLLLAQMNLNQGHFDAALKQYDLVLKQNPKDPDALFGQARTYYFQGDVDRAYLAGSALLLEQPKNVDALFLMANLERARRNRTAALALLDETLKLSPNHAEAKALRKSIHEAGKVSLATTASFVRETGRAILVPGQPELLNEDLREFTYGATLGFAALPKTDSFLSMTFFPSSTPLGGLRGAAGPSQFLYRQVSEVGRRVKIRSAIGLVRFGPGNPVSLPGQPERVTVSEFSPLAILGLSYTPTKKLGLDAGWNRSAVAYTPTATRFGVIENRLGTSASYNFTPRVHLFLGYYYGRYSTGQFDHISFVNGQRIVNRRSDQDRVHGGSALFTVNAYRSSGFAVDVGYSGNIYGHAGPRIFLGFYNPGFNQAHLFTTRFYGKLWGPLGYEFSSGIGIQQAEDEDPRRALQLSPAFNLRASPRVSFRFGYTYYNTAQALSTLGGNAFFLTTNWTF